MNHLASPRFWRHYRALPEGGESSLIRISNCSKLILIIHRCISRRLIGSGLFGLALITGRLVWTQLIQLCGFGLVHMRIMTSSSNRGSRTLRLQLTTR